MRDTPRYTNIWNLTEARAKLSEVFDRTLTGGRQELHRRDDVVVFLSKADYDAKVRAMEERNRSTESPANDRGKTTSDVAAEG